MRETEIVVLRLLQEEFPVRSRPFLEIACRANRGFCRPRTVYFEVIGPGSRRRAVVARHKVKPVSERDVMTATSNLIRRGYIRRIGGVFGPRVDAPPGSKVARVIEELMSGLPVVPQPYREVARRLSLAEEDLLEKIETLRRAGYLRRLGAVLCPPIRQSKSR